VRGGGGNSDFYPVLDLGAERTRYLRTGAQGFMSLAGDRFGLAPLYEGRHAARGTSTKNAMPGVLPLEAMELGARMRSGDFADATEAKRSAAERAHSLEQMLASSRTPVDWRAWVDAVRDAEETRAGGSRGVADSALFGAVERYLARQSPPSEARAAIAFLHGLAAQDFAEVTRAARPLIDAARQGNDWLAPDLLLDGSVVAALRQGDLRSARAAMVLLMPRSARTRDDVRVRLLEAWVADATRAEAAASRGHR
jgi:hypothetical protein